MNFNLEEFEKEQDKVRESNENHLKGFRIWLINKGLSERTSEKHVSNAEFYINEYLCYYEILDITQGCYEIGNFLGDWFIRKAPSSYTGIKDNAAGLKKFYEFLVETGAVEMKDYDYLCAMIKLYMPTWLKAMRRYERMIFEDY